MNDTVYPQVDNTNYATVYRQGYLAGRKGHSVKNLVKNLRKLLWFAIECALILSIFKGCFG